jgi:hypothetical protein
MRTGGTFDVPYTGGDNEILPRLPVLAETPTDVDGTISNFRHIYAKFKNSSTKSFYVRL